MHTCMHHTTAQKPGQAGGGRTGSTSAHQRMLPLLLRLLPLPSSNGLLLPPEEDMWGGSCKLYA